MAPYIALGTTENAVGWHDTVDAPMNCEKDDMTIHGHGDVWCMKHHLKVHPPKFNMEPENDGFQKESPFPWVHVQLPC